MENNLKNKTGCFFYNPLVISYLKENEIPVITAREMTINANTKISKLLKASPDALEAIVSIAPKLEKLRNPFLRRLMAGRTSIAQAAKISGAEIEAFYEKLKPLGFEPDRGIAVEEDTGEKDKPEFLRNLASEKLHTLDVRPTIEAGKDPLKDIMKAVKGIPAGGALKVINSFEPTPLLNLLEKQGYKYYVNIIDDKTTEAWFYKEGGGGTDLSATVNKSLDQSNQGFEEIKQSYGDKIVEIDVRHLQMPQPMMTILGTLEDFPDDHALYVNHKRIPVFLLPELDDRGYEYRTKEISDGDVKLLIFKKK